MIRLHETIDIPRPIDDVFAYASDFGICSPPYRLTQTLLPRRLESAPSRVINLSSGGMYGSGARP